MLVVLGWLFFFFHQEAQLFQYSGSQNKESHVTIFIWIFTNDLGAEKGELFWCLEGQNKELLRCGLNVRALFTNRTAGKHRDTGDGVHPDASSCRYLIDMS